jgi:hypothetical protein
MHLLDIDLSCLHDPCRHTTRRLAIKNPLLAIGPVKGRSRAGRWGLLLITMQLFEIVRVGPVCRSRLASIPATVSVVVRGISS